MQLWRLTDEQFIARLKIINRMRRVVACLCIVLGVALTTATIWFGYEIHQKFQGMAVTFTEKAEDTEMADQWDNLNSKVSLLSFILGILVGCSSLIGGVILFFGFGGLFFRDRKTELLLSLIENKDVRAPPEVHSLSPKN